MRIAISGVQCTGKTTLLNAIEQLDEFRDYKIIREVVRSMKNITINEYGDDASQLAIADAHIRNLKYRDMITDRCIMDCYADGMYCYNHGTVSDGVIRRVKGMYNDIINEYDLIVYIKPEFALVSDGTRSVNTAFRNEVLQYFNDLVLDTAKKYHNVVTVSGSVRKRVDEFLDAYYEVAENGHISSKNH